MAARKKRAKTVDDVVREQYGAQAPLGDGELAKLEKKQKRARRPPPATDQEMARAQLRRVVAEYEALVEEAKRTKQRTGDYHDRDTGEVINACRLSPEQIAMFQSIGSALDDAAELVRKEMNRLCRAFPIYDVFLKDALGIGVVTSAKLLADIDIRRCEKVSSLQRVCGLAVRVDGEGYGRAQRAQAGVVLDFHNRLKVGLYQAWTSLVKCAARESSPYYRRGIEYKHRLLSSPRFVESTAKKDATGKPAATFDGRPGGRAIVNNMTWRPAMQLFVEHLYIVWRTLEGLPVWPSYEAVKLGYGHGGKVVVNVPKLLTLEQAMGLVRPAGSVQAAE